RPGSEGETQRPTGSGRSGGLRLVRRVPAAPVDFVRSGRFRALRPVLVAPAGRAWPAWPARYPSDRVATPLTPCLERTLRVYEALPRPRPTTEGRAFWNAATGRRP